MDNRRFAGLLGTVYLILGAIGALLSVFPKGALQETVHLIVAFWGVTAASMPGASVRFARYAALLIGALVLIESTPALRELADPLMDDPIGYLPIHLVTAPAAAYYGYYWTDTVSEADGRERKAA